MNRWLIVVCICCVIVSLWQGCASKAPATYALCQRDQDCAPQQRCVNQICIGFGHSTEPTASTETHTKQESESRKEPVVSTEPQTEPVTEVASDTTGDTDAPIDGSDAGGVPEFPQDYDPCSNPNTIKAEECNGLDDDCDGRVDNVKGTTEPLTDFCYDGLQDTLRPNSPCRRGTTRCQNGAWEKCVGQVLPKTESCNNQDDDCNGQIDDNVSDIGKACDVPNLFGECKKGKQFCENGQLVCRQVTTLRSELCDNKDNDCDGKVDGFTRECYTGPSNVAGVGQCQKGTQICENGQWSQECKGEKLPDPKEVCDASNIDENCDGFVNEGCSCKNGTKQACGQTGGLCKAGTQVCANGQWGLCKDAIGPTPEVCDGQDNDCDGKVDQGNPDGGANCTIQGAFGPCAQGKLQCQNAKLTCIATARSQPEICDGIDNDCNGKIDDGVLKTFYRDKDQDGYGNIQDSKQACKPPPGYIAQLGDCDDDNKDVHPGQKNYFSNKRSNGTFDYDCNGKDDKEYPTGGDCSNGCKTTRKGFAWWVPRCGDSGWLIKSCKKAFIGCSTDAPWTQQKCR